MKRSQDWRAGDVDEVAVDRIVRHCLREDTPWGEARTADRDAAVRRLVRVHRWSVDRAGRLLGLSYASATRVIEAGR